MLRNLIVAGVAALGLASTPAADAHGIVVRPTPVHYHHVPLRVGHWHERTFYCPLEAAEFRTRMIYQGYDAYLIRHGHHIDVRYRLPY